MSHPATVMAQTPRVRRAWEVLCAVPDPEVPVISVCELGIVRDVIEHGSELEVVLTPTYSGCPATEAIEHDVLAALQQAGLGPARVSLRRAPAWTTDWIGPEAREKLRSYGIAPPGPAPAGAEVVLHFMPRTGRDMAPPCPQCGSARTERLSAFGSTACKALCRCLDCREPFEAFKSI